MCPRPGGIFAAVLGLGIIAARPFDRDAFPLGIGAHGRILDRCDALPPLRFSNTRIEIRQDLPHRLDVIGMFDRSISLCPPVGFRTLRHRFVIKPLQFVIAGQVPAKICRTAAAAAKNPRECYKLGVGRVLQVQRAGQPVQAPKIHDVFVGDVRPIFVLSMLPAVGVVIGSECTLVIRERGRDTLRSAVIAAV